MNFYVDSGGAILGVEPEKIYQGSANANTIRFVGAFASNVKVTVAFKLPTGVWTTPQLMTASTQLAGVVTSTGVQFNVWEYSIPALVTETFGTVNMQFYVYGDAGNGNGGLIATASSSFQVERGVPITLPDPTDDYETLLTQILSALSQIEGQIPGMEEDITGLQSKVSDISDKVSTLSDVTTELMSDVDNLSIQVSDLSEDKLDKQSGATAYEEAYVKDTDGSQKMERVTITSIASAIVKRDANGNINIAKGLSGNPKNGANMENIADVEEKISKCPTLDGNNDFTGENTFEEAIQAKKGTVVKNSLDETNYNAGYISRNDWTYLFPADSGTFALTKDIPTDYATQTALANTQRQVDGLYTLLEQKNEIYVQTATDTYTTRETAGGENIADGVQTPVKKITGKTVKTTNLFNLNATPIRKINATLSTTGDTFIATATSENANVCFEIAVSIGQTYTVSLQSLVRENPGGMGSAEYLKNIFISSTNFADSADYGHLSEENDVTFTAKTEFVYIQFYVTYSFDAEKPATISVTGLQLNAGSTALPYMPYFSGLKNAFFKEIVSTGRNLIPYPEPLTSQSGITFTENEDGTFYANGTAEKKFFVFVSSFSLSAGTYYLSGTPEGGSSSTYQLYAITPEGVALVYREGSFSLDKLSTVRIWLAVYEGTTLNNLLFKPMLNYGSSALPYEPYTQSVLFLPEAVELTEYDTAYPETGEIQRQSNTLTFNGTEIWQDYSDDTRFIYTAVLSKGAVRNLTDIVCNLYPTTTINGVTLTGDNGSAFTSIQVIFSKSLYPNFSTVEAWKAQLSEWNEAGNPLTVTYKTAEATTEQADFSADSYIAWKNGSETIKQGNTDNSIYGAENTVEQDYYLLTAPEEVTKE